MTFFIIFVHLIKFSTWLFWSLARWSDFQFTFDGLIWWFSIHHFNKLHLLPFSLAAIHRNSPRPVKVPRCHSDPPNPHLIIPTPEGFRYLVLLQSFALWILLWYACWCSENNWLLALRAKCFFLSSCSHAFKNSYLRYL